MPKIKLTLTGYSPISYVSCYDDEFKNKLTEFADESFDQEDFFSEHLLFSKWVGRGLDADNDVSVVISEDGKEDRQLTIAIYEDSLEDEIGSADKHMGAKHSDMIDIGADDQFFGHVDKYNFASIELVETHEASASVIIDVDERWHIGELNVVCVDIDSAGSFAELFYQEAGIEKEVAGIRYKGTLYQFDHEYEGGHSNWTYLEKDEDGEWHHSYEIGSLIDEKNNSW